MNKILLLLLALSVTAGASSSYKGSTLAPTVIAGAIIKASHEPDTFKKYARKAQLGEVLEFVPEFFVDQALDQRKKHDDLPLKFFRIEQTYS